jgi:hypothetical protein
MNNGLLTFLVNLRAYGFKAGYGFIEFETEEGNAFVESDSQIDQKLIEMIQNNLSHVKLVMMPFDQFIAQTLGSGIVNRTITLERGSEPTLLVVNGFCDSVIFDKEFLLSIPSQESIGFKLNPLPPQKMLMGKLDLFAEVFGKSTFGFSPLQMLEWLQTFSLTHQEAKYLLNWYYVYADKSYWQSLWYQNKGLGMPLLLIMPHEYHDAVVRYNQFKGNDGNDFRKRTSFGNTFLPKDPEGFDPDNLDFVKSEGTDSDFESFRSRIEPLIDKVK